jgi:hypothetical protein
MTGAAGRAPSARRAANARVAANRTELDAAAARRQQARGAAEHTASRDAASLQLQIAANKYAAAGRWAALPVSPPLSARPCQPAPT